MSVPKKFRGYDFTVEDWLALCEMHGNKCASCGEEKPLCVDHIKPRAAGGTNGIDNVQPLCHRCNSKKGSKYDGVTHRYTGQSDNLTFHIRQACRKKAAMENRNVRMSTVSEETGISMATLRNAMATGGGSMTLATLEKLCAYFEVQSISDLIEWKPDTKPDTKPTDTGEGG